MISLEELKDWDAYRLFLRKHLKLLGAEPEYLYVSAARHDFTIKGAKWKGYFLLLGKFARPLSKQVRKDGTRLIEGTCTGDGKLVQVHGLSEQQIKNVQLTLKKLKLGFEAVPAGAGPSTDDGPDLRELFLTRRKGEASRIREAATGDDPHCQGIRARIVIMAQRERASDWAGALQTLDEVVVLLDEHDGAKDTSGIGARRGREVSAEENAELAALSDAELRGVDLTHRDATALLKDDDYLHALTETDIPYAEDKNLKKLMRVFEKGVSGKDRERAIKALSLIVREPERELDADYGRFLVLRRQQRDIGKKNRQEEVPEVNELVHYEFMASKPQLLFGKVLGDVFDIHPVFAALLSSTGGLVGPGNKSVQLEDTDPTGYHGIVHDAGGYLYNYHDQGPGYDYLGREDRPDDDPLTGQQSGMRYWHEKLEPGPETDEMNEKIDDVAETYDDLKEAWESGKKSAEEVQVEAEKALESVRDSVTETFEEALDMADEAVDSLRTGMDKAAHDTANAVEEVYESAEETAVEAAETVAETVGAATEEVKEKLEAAWDYIWN